jgi:hypothetical protein
MADSRTSASTWPHRGHATAGRKSGLGGLNVGAAAQLLPKQRPDRPTGVNADRRGNIQKLQHAKKTGFLMV